MMELIDAGEIGEISMSESNFCTERGLELTPERWRSSRELNPTGVVIQLSIHHIDTFRYLHGTKGVAHFRITGQQWRDPSDP